MGNDQNMQIMFLNAFVSAWLVALMSDFHISEIKINKQILIWGVMQIF